MLSFPEMLLQVSLILSSVVAFSHPGLLVTDTDIARIKTKLAARTEPWQASWDKLTNLKYSQSTWTDSAVSRVHRGTYNGASSNAALLWHDIAAAFNLGLRWKIEGNESCAEAASNILGAWGRTLTDLDDTDDQYLLSGLQGSELVNAAELIRDYPAFESSGNAQAFKIMMQNVFVAKNIFFLNHQAPSEHNVKHFHANWELSNMASAMAFGVYTDNATLFEYVLDYFKNGDGNGAINNAFTNIVAEPGTGVVMAQPQEAGRDQGHTALDFQLHGVICQQAWNQGVDLWGYNESRVLQGAEYFARYNLGNDIPFSTWTNNIQTFTTVSNQSRGATRPTWELYFAHYVQLKGVAAPWTTKYREYTLNGAGYETGVGAGGDTSGQYDGLGWGSLLHRLDEDDVPPVNISSSSVMPSISSIPVAFSTYTTPFISVITSSSSVGVSTTRLPSNATPYAIKSTSASFGTSVVPHDSAVSAFSSAPTAPPIQPSLGYSVTPAADAITMSSRRNAHACSRRPGRRSRGSAHNTAPL